MSRLIVMFNLQSSADVDAYESWAAATDLPIVRNLPSVDGFTLHRISGLFGTDAPAPYQYVEIIDINNLDTFGADVSTDTMQKVAAEFRGFADNPVFMLSDEIPAAGAA
ncbi:MAG: REDY-like protein HapK [Gammaproteobacteria bacterium]|nr:REDY-like protein HapK [Gammaproteobacteria bacterium]NND53427.1 REDY-like protein HapK [Gammaproteobacteria bacterium]